MPDFSKALQQLRPRESPQRQLFQADNPVASLSRQLAFLKSRPVSSRLPEEPIQGIEEVTPLGRHLLIRNIFDAGHHHGSVRLNRLSPAELQRFMNLMRGKGSVTDRGAVVFLDTETTGIQGGTGMVPFLVGLGFLEDEDFHMVQYFIRDFDEEPSMLLALGDLLHRFKLVVTYNGATFDVPLLETRFTLARLDSPFTGMAHLDLLPGARRLWRNAHGSCRLSALEQKIVGFGRYGDIPGGLIPRAYFDYLQGRGSAAIASVLRHNVDDVLSLAALTIRACDRVTGEPAAFEDPLDLYSLARILENSEDWNRALRLYEAAIQGDMPAPFSFKARESLLVLWRRSGKHERALELCEALMRESSFSLAAYEGAAIHHERVSGDLTRALEIVEEGIARLEGTAVPKRWTTALQTRRERLRQKVIRF